MADVQISTTSAPANTHSPRALVYTSALVGYAFYIDSDNVFKYKKTTDGGASWGSAVTVRAATVVAFDVWFAQWTPGQSGTLIYCWYIESGGSDVLFRTLDTDGDSLGTERTVFNGASTVDVRGRMVSGALMRGGNLLVYYDIDGGSEQGTRRSTDGGVNWGTRTSLGTGGTSFVHVFPGNEADANDAWALVNNHASDTLILKVHDDSADTNSSSSTIVAITENTGTNTSQFPFAGSVQHSDGHLIVAVWTERDAATGDFRVFDINGTGSIVELTALATNVDDCYYCSVFTFGSHIYITYVGKRDGSETLGTTVGIYYVVSSDRGVTWSAGDTAYSEDANGNWGHTWCPPAGPRFAVMWAQTSGQVKTGFTNSIVPRSSARSILLNQAVSAGAFI